MGKTLAEKIIGSHAKKEVSAGQIALVGVDVCLTQDGTGPLAIRQLQKINLEKAVNPKRTVLFLDHAAPSPRRELANDHITIRKFAQKTGACLSEVGEGVCHQIIAESYLNPGDILIGADSHTCTGGALGAFATGMGSTDIAAAMASGQTWLKVPQTIKFVYHGQLQPWVGGKDLILHTIGHIGVDGALYAAIEFGGQAVDALSMAGRFTMANMAIEAGAKTGLFHVDEKAQAYVQPRARREYTVYTSDPDAEYARVIEMDASQIELQVAFPYLPENTRPLSQVNHVPIDQVVIGSCTNGRLDDLQVAARVLAGHQVHRDVRCIVIPATQAIYLEAVRQGLVETFVEAGAVVSTPTCGPCLGGYMGVLAAGERAVATTNRNFRGRMGHPDSEVYLAGPAVAAASAVMGRIGGPQEVL